MSNYTYTIYDADPARSGPCEWPSHVDVAIEADDDSEARDAVVDALEVAAAGLSEADGYSVGQSIYAQIAKPDGTADVASYALTAEDLS